MEFILAGGAVALILPSEPKSMLSRPFHRLSKVIHAPNLHNKRMSILYFEDSVENQQINDFHLHILISETSIAPESDLCIQDINKNLFEQSFLKSIKYKSMIQWVYPPLTGTAMDKLELLRIWY
jgi:hypothetical protein